MNQRMRLRTRLSAHEDLDESFSFRSCLISQQTAFKTPDSSDDVKENFHLQRVQCGGAAKFGKVKIEKVFAGRAFTANSQL